MKDIISLHKARALVVPVLVSFLMAGCYTMQTQSSNSDQTSQIGEQTGYNLADLDNYGEWVQINNYGNAWRPYVVEGWTPYDNGHWYYTNSQWTWVSYEPFGWIVYHYGYWFDDETYGWVWIPTDDNWSPARVTWIDYDDNVGWAPLGPPGVLYGNPWDLNKKNGWHVVNQKVFTQDNIGKYTINNPSVRNDNGGRGVSHTQPGRSNIEKSSGRPVPDIKVQQTTVRTKKRTVTKINLPPAEDKKVEQFTPNVKKNVLVPRDQYKKQQEQKKQQPKVEPPKKEPPKKDTPRHNNDGRN